VAGMRIRQPIDRWGDVALAAALAAGAQLELRGASPTAVVARGGRGTLVVPLLAITLPVAWRRSRPVPALAVSVGGLAAAALLITHSGGLPLSVYLALLLLFYSVGAHSGERAGLLAAAGGVAAVAAVDVARSLFQASGPRLGAWLSFVVAWLVGREVRRRGSELALLRERAARLELEREAEARSAVADERARIARELHDVVAHSVSVMVVQAQAGPRLLDDRGAAGSAFRSIEAAGREALVELRRLLGILRTADEQLAVGPQPGLASLRSLVEQVEGAGLPVTVRVEGEPVALPPGVDLSAYRIVQEALTNTLKHAGPADAEIVVRYGPAALELEVLDSGGGPNGHSGTGHGLIGMRERAALYGGSLEAGARAPRGYAVRARLPLTGGARS
jgi:signal transduction histidine kinase